MFYSAKKRCEVKAKRCLFGCPSMKTSFWQYAILLPEGFRMVKTSVADLDADWIRIQEGKI
jgi:hypothetical protein